MRELPKKMTTYHRICINFKKLKMLDDNAKDFSKKVIAILPETSKKFEMHKKLNYGKKTCNLKIFLKNEVDDYFQKNFAKCATYLAWKQKIKHNV